MADSKLNIRIDVDDNASGKLGGLKGALGGLGGIAKGALVGGVAAAGAAIVGLGAVLASSTKDAMAAEEAQAQLAAVLESTGGAAGVTAEAANAYADAMSKVTRFDDEAILSAENIMLTFTQIGKDVFPDAMTAALDMSQALGQDLQSSVIQLGKALQDPVAGLTALRRVGVNVNEAMIDQVKAIMGDNEQLEKLGDAARSAEGDMPGLARKVEIASTKLKEMEASGKATESQLLKQRDALATAQEKYAEAGQSIDAYKLAQEAANTGMTESERLMQAQKLILGELKTEFGGAAEAAGQTFGGQMDILKTQLGNVKEQIGGALLPVLTDLAQKLGPQLVAGAQKFADWFTSTGAPALESLFRWVGETLPPAIETLAAFWSGTLYPALQTVGNWMQTNLVPVLQTLFQWLGETIPPVIEAMADFWTNTLYPALQTVGNWIKTYLVPVLQTYFDVWKNQIYPALVLVGDFMVQHVMPVVQALNDLIGAVMTPVLKLFGEVWREIILPAIRSVWSILKEKLFPALGEGQGFLTTFKGILDGIGSALDTVAGWLTTVAEKIRSLPEIKIKIPSLPAWAQKLLDTPGASGYATGTMFAPGGLAWVGERGPELVNLPRGAQVYPAEQSRAMAARAGATWNVSINISGGGDAQAIGNAARRGVLEAARAMGAA